MASRERETGRLGVTMGLRILRRHQDKRCKMQLGGEATLVNSISLKLLFPLVWATYSSTEFPRGGTLGKHWTRVSRRGGNINLDFNPFSWFKNWWGARSFHRRPVCIADH